MILVVIMAFSILKCFLKWVYSHWRTTVLPYNNGVVLTLKILIIIELCKFREVKKLLYSVKRVQQIAFFGLFVGLNFGYRYKTVENASNTIYNNVLQNNGV